MSHTHNAFLASLSDQSLPSHLTRVHLRQQQILYEPHQQIMTVAFPFNAVVSLVTVLSNGVTVEAAMVGHDGVVGAVAAIDGRVASERAVVQIGGEGLSCSVEKLRSLMTTDLQRALFRHQQAVLAQAQQAAACNVSHVIESRLARWLLRAHDLTGSKELELTQQFLADMLGVQRSSVSLIAHTLQQAGLIKYHRGHVELLDIDALKETACECYEAVKFNYDALLKPSND